MRGSSRTFVWCMGLGGSAVLRVRDRTASVFCVVLAVCEKIWTCVCAELGSTFELEHDLGCFEHVLTHSNRLVWFVLSETDVLQSRSDLPSPLASVECADFDTFEMTPPAPLAQVPGDLGISLLQRAWIFGCRPRLKARAPPPYEGISICSAGSGSQKVPVCMFWVEIVKNSSAHIISITN